MKLLFVLLALMATSQAQATVDDAMVKLYAQIDGDQGSTMDSLAMYDLFMPTATINVIGKGQGEGIVHSLDIKAYMQAINRTRQQYATAEKELSRHTQQWGEMALVQSSYVFTLSDAGRLIDERKGVNWVQLIFTNGTWRILSVHFQEATASRKLPK